MSQIRRAAALLFALLIAAQPVTVLSQSRPSLRQLFTTSGITSAIAKTTAGPQTVTGTVPAGATANFIKNGSVVGAATVSASGAVSYGPVTLGGGDSVSFSWSLTGQTPVSVVPGPPSLSALYMDMASEVLPSVASLSRASAATYTAPTTTSSTNLGGLRALAAANAPRFDFTTSIPTLLVEPAATNTILQSKPTSAAWSINNNDSANTAITYNSAVGADGTQTMALVAANSTASTTRQMEQDGAVIVAGQTNCVSFDAGAAGETAGHVQLNINTTGGLSGAMVVFYSLTGNGAVMVGGDLAGSVSGKMAAITPLQNSLYRVSSCFSAPATATTANVYLGPVSANYAANGRNYTGTVGKGILIGEVQMEAGAYSTSPIRTTTAAATRNADAVSFSGQAATYLNGGNSYVLEQQSLVPGSAVTRVQGNGPLTTLPTGYRYTKVAIYSRVLSASEATARLALGFDLSNDNLSKSFNAGVNLNLFHGYGPVNPTVAGSSYTVLTDAMVADLVSFGVKYVRLPIRWEQIDPNRTGSFDANTMSVLDAALAKFSAAGIKALIDIHNSFIFCTNASNINDASSYHYLGNSDGVVTQAQYVALMQGLAARYKTNAAVSGIDMMNEPQVTATVASNAYKAAIPAMRSAGYTNEAIVEVTDSDIASGLYPIPDPGSNIRWSHHDYPIAGGASGDYGSANAIAQNIPVRTLVNKLRAAFQAFVTANGGKGHIGEYAVGLDSTYWTGTTGMLDSTLALARANDWRATFWDYDGDPTITDANNLSYLDGGARPRPQRVVLGSYNDTSVAATAAIIGPSTSYRLATNNLIFDFRGIPAATTTYTFSDGGKGGTFAPTSVTLTAGNFNAYVPVVYTAPSSDQTVSLTATNNTGAVSPTALSLAVSGAAPAAAGYTPPTLDGQQPNVSAKWTGTPAFYGVSNTAAIVGGSPPTDANGLATNGLSVPFTTALKNLMATTGPATLMVEVASFSGVSSGNRFVGSNGSGPGALIYSGGNSVVAYAADGSGGPQASSGGSAASPTRMVLAWDGASIKLSVGGSAPVTVANTAGIRPEFLGSTDGTQDFSPVSTRALAVYNFKASDSGMQTLSAGTTPN